MHDALAEFEPITRNGRPWLRHAPTGREIPVVRGGADDGGTGAGDPPAGGQPPAGQPPATGALTQADVDKAATAAARKATSDAQKQFEAWLAGEKDKADTASMDEVSRARKEAETAKSEAEALRNEATKERQAARIERLLTAQGVPEQSMRRAVAAVGDVALDATAEDLATAVDELKRDAPGLFGPVAAGAAPRAPSSFTAGRPPAAGTGGASAREAAEAELRRRGHLPQPATT